MIIKVYEDIFEVTKTLQNGKERRIKKSVLSPTFRNGKHLIQLDRETKAIKQLEELGYYEIQWVNTRVKTLMTTGNLEGKEE